MASTGIHHLRMANTKQYIKKFSRIEYESIVYELDTVRYEPEWIIGLLHAYGWNIFFIMWNVKSSVLLVITLTEFSLIVYVF